MKYVEIFDNYFNFARIVGLPKYRIKLEWNANIKLPFLFYLSSSTPPLAPNVFLWFVRLMISEFIG